MCISRLGNNSMEPKAGTLDVLLYVLIQSNGRKPPPEYNDIHPKIGFHEVYDSAIDISYFIGDYKY